MSLNKDSKKAVVANIEKVFNGAQTVVLAEYRGVTVNNMTIVRKKARKSNVYFHILKNTLARIAVKDTKFSPLVDKMYGSLVYSISEDPVAAAKVVHEFAKDNEIVKIVAGMCNEKVLDVNAVKMLASIPSREELLATTMGLMQQIPASFVRCINAIKEKKEAVSA